MTTKLLTFAAAAQLASNSPSWWRKLAAGRGIVVVKLGRSARLRSEDVERIIRDGCRPAGEEGLATDRREPTGAPSTPARHHAGCQMNPHR